MTDAKIQVIKNNFSIYQIKKMIGKKLIVIYPLIVVSIHDKNAAKLLKTKINEQVDKKTKNLTLNAMCNGGILYVFKNIDVYLFINSLSYKELDSGSGNNINIIINQYPKMTKAEIKKML